MGLRHPWRQTPSCQSHPTTVLMIDLMQLTLPQAVTLLCDFASRRKVPLFAQSAQRVQDFWKQPASTTTIIATAVLVKLKSGNKNKKITYFYVWKI